ncbi:Hypothetical protein PHPALM_20389 [Phytophthora palmivora]|uniref:Uncharacterized protein n=1 Tax=Phytophthora palmivora TaxID=4796 RepID=A0A2P4XF10_9STRA|nr:Hypothetical protein PHPALM_20389 [Phytophthora palmivora]
MAKGVWMSEEEVERIVQMRNEGVPVTAIAKQVERSTNYIYRILKKRSSQHQQQQHKKKVANVPVQSTNELAQGLADSNEALLCAVDSMEVSTYEPIPIPRSMSETQAQLVRTGPVNASVGFTGAPSSTTGTKPQDADLNENFWLLTDATPPTARPASDPLGRPSKKHKTSLSQAQSEMTSAPSLSSGNQQFQRRGLITTIHATSANSGGFLKLLQDEIRRLEGVAQGDVYDAQLLQMLVKFHAELLLVQLQKTHFIATATRASGLDADTKETSRLLHEKLAKEIAVLNVQADRERLELEREQIKHKTTTMVCRLLNSLDDTNQHHLDQ